MIIKKRVLIFFILGCLLVGCSPNETLTIEQEENEISLIEVSPEIIISTLDSLGYFNMTPNEELGSSKQEIKELYIDYKLFENKQFFDSIRYVDYRFYWLDGEELYEEGGLISYLKEVKITFDKLNLKLDFNNDEVQFKGDSLIHTIYINETKYIAFNDVFNHFSWGHATYNFALILNTELKKQKSNERVYLISGGNDGRMVFLTEDMYKFITSVYPKGEELPMEINTWRNENGK